ncbi:MAG TPA: hypothetical protein VM101_11245 [Flavitalea sp.]|nr:hypothetical protein [Flavitalea sp.]
MAKVSFTSLPPRPFDDDEWPFKVKWDGYRMMAYVEKGEVDLRARNDKPYTACFKIIADKL